jgi:hypothetical protein
VAKTLPSSLRVPLLQGPVSPPTGDIDMTRFLNDVDRHEDTLEVQMRYAALFEEVRQRGGTAVEQWSVLLYGSRRGLHKARRALHDRIMEELVVDDARSPMGQPFVVVLLGPPAAGKTSRGVPLAKERHNVGFVSASADAVKERLPEYQGWNSAALHEESTSVAREVRDIAIAQRMNVLYEITGSHVESVKQGITNFAALGYQVSLLLMDLAPWRAAWASWERFESNPFGINPNRAPGQYVPPKLVYNSIGERPRKTFDQLKDHPNVSRYCRVDATSPLGQEPQIVETNGW